MIGFAAGPRDAPVGVTVDVATQREPHPASRQNHGEERSWCAGTLGLRNGGPSLAVIAENVGMQSACSSLRLSGWVREQRSRRDAEQRRSTRKSFHLLLATQRPDGYLPSSQWRPGRTPPQPPILLFDDSRQIEVRPQRSGLR